MINQIEQAVILCAGKGQRMGNVYKDIQKCAISINGEPLIVQNVKNLIENGVKKIFLLTGHKAKQIEQCFVKTSYKKHLEFIFCGNPYETPLNTLSTLANAKPFINKPFLCLHGDILFRQVLIAKLSETFIAHHPAMIISVSNKTHIAPTHTRVDYDGNSIVKNLKNPRGFIGDVWMGVDLCQPHVISQYCENKKLTCQKDLAEKLLINKEKIMVVRYEEMWFHITTPDDLLMYSDINKEEENEQRVFLSVNRKYSKPPSHKS